MVITPIIIKKKTYCAFEPTQEFYLYIYRVISLQSLLSKYVIKCVFGSFINNFSQLALRKNLFMVLYYQQLQFILTKWIFTKLLH